MGKPVVSGWNRVARALHWGTALAVLIEVPAGFIMSWTYAARDPAGKGNHILSSQIHHTLGMLLLIAVVFRIVWRMTHDRPPPPPSSSRLEVVLAAAVQGLLYLLLLALPLSGWAALSSMAAGGGYPAPELWFFGTDGFGPHGFIPHIVPPVEWNAPVLFKYGFFARIHIWGLWLGGALLILHIAGALKQHFIARSDVLVRMWANRDADQR
ncbi:cytochrome b [Novosphingobium sp. KACC 22771]|uniref:cytochrome b n=1 Tax=Novosphingobium sp. KACC 22771 TaxID=3025670 RepID=UPI002366D239|nr:cytochrome b/b6 domain-containing protein [Novosphingobium sp. KACC 22771]WDF74834.1 cytochrome b/b6 domain-containing protein [Novosphingobium sp. KACC 22771]